ncbi:50S ribosomal protein L20 [Candidatus Dojkabacteria bacterium]|nr:50S ribosomal protein L20 [Candidatus Dojkabacteria bacterium]
MRVKGGIVTRRRHKKVLKATKGFRLTKSKLYKVAHEAFLHAGQYSFQHRRKRINDFRRLWIARINAALKAKDLSYNIFIHNLRKKNVQLNRHVLAELAVNADETFNKVVDFVNA